LNQNRSSLDAPEFVRGKLKDRDAAAREILLVAQVLIRCEEQIELAFSQFEQPSIFDSAPALLLRGATFVADEQPVHGPRHTLIEQNLHADTGSSRADSEHSKIWHAIARVTDGKHSKNSSKE
jgi:hypothetical protein